MFADADTKPYAEPTPFFNTVTVTNSDSNFNSIHDIISDSDGYPHAIANADTQCHSDCLNDADYDSKRNQFSDADYD